MVNIKKGKGNYLQSVRVKKVIRCNKCKKPLKYGSNTSGYCSACYCRVKAIERKKKINKYKCPECGGLYETINDVIMVVCPACQIEMVKQNA